MTLKSYFIDFELSKKLVKNKLTVKNKTKMIFG